LPTYSISPTIAPLTAAGNFYEKGTIYRQDQINRALQGGSPLPTRDAIAQDTANTALPPEGRNSKGKYRGIAPQPTIITGRQQHGDQAAEFGSQGAPLMALAHSHVRLMGP